MCGVEIYSTSITTTNGTVIAVIGLYADQYTLSALLKLIVYLLSGLPFLTFPSPPTPTFPSPQPSPPHTHTHTPASPSSSGRSQSPPLLFPGATVTWPPQSSSSHDSLHHVATTTVSVATSTSTSGAVAVYTPGGEGEGADSSGLECATYTVTEEDYQDDNYEWEAEAYDP